MMGLGVIRYVDDYDVLHVEQVEHISCRLDDNYNKIYCIQVDLSYSEEPLLLFVCGIDFALDVTDEIFNCLAEFGCCEWALIVKFCEGYGGEEDVILH